MRYFCCLLIGLTLLPCSVDAKDWTGFRGEGGSATSDETNLPTRWSTKKNIVWRTKLPGPGTSSPITLGDRIYLTSYSGYAVARDNPGEMNKLMRHVVCINRTDGAIVWKKDFEPELPESKYSGGNNSWHGYCSSTIATDGKNLYVFFGKSGVYCLSAEDGAEVWHKTVGAQTRGWGSANSPVLFENLLIVNASIESSAIVALNKSTGEEVWKANNIRGAWNTPLLVPLPDGKVEVVVSLPGKPIGHVVGFDARSGEELWRAEAIPDGGYICPSLIAHAGVVYAVGGRKNTTVAIKAGGRGDVTKTHLLWSTSKGSNVSSPVYHAGHIYWIHERKGAAYCLNAQTGKVVYEKRLEPRPGIVYSSLMVADGKLYCVSQKKGTYVLAAKPEYELLAHNVLADDDSRTNASPIVSHGQILMRNDKYLYCIGK